MNQRISTKQQTIQRHKDMFCKSYLLKIDKSHLSKARLGELERLFLEAKWFTNYAIANGVFDTSYRVKSVSIKVGDKTENRDITILSSQMRQSILDKLKQDIKKSFYLEK